MSHLEQETYIFIALSTKTALENGQNIPLTARKQSAVVWDFTIQQSGQYEQGNLTFKASIQFSFFPWNMKQGHLSSSDKSLQQLEEPLKRRASPLVPVWGKSSSQPWPTQCTPDTAPPPDPWLLPCPRTSPAGSEPAGPLWPWRWSWGRAVHTSAGLRALRRK